MSPAPYEDLVGSVDALTSEIARRRAADLACKRGCTACCHVQLTVTPIEAQRIRGALAALPPEPRAHLRERARELNGLDAQTRGEPCVMLAPGGVCSVYSARPLVCRTQGHALRYPAGSLEETAIFARAGGGEITWCPLNYIERAPKSEDVLQAERIDTALGEACIANDDDPLRRFALVDLALEP